MASLCIAFFVGGWRKICNFADMSNKITVPTIIRLPEGGSSNSIMSSQAADLPHGAVVALVAQTAGRGQRGNSWEAAPGENITMSMLFRPESVRPSEQFMLSEMVSIGIVQFLRNLLGDCREAERVSIKWPNDIYVGDRKICGILIEHSLMGGRIAHTIAGIGVNINQMEFLSDAPNPVSVAQLTGRRYPVEECERMLAEILLGIVNEYDDAQRWDELHQSYLSLLWRREGVHPYCEPQTGRRFMARIDTVLPTGHLQLTDMEGATKLYAFKEVRACPIINVNDGAVRH